MIYQEQPENVEYFNCFGKMLTNAAKFALEIKSRIDRAKATFNEETLFTTKQT